jgi:hypothetical protein
MFIIHSNKNNSSNNNNNNYFNYNNNNYNNNSKAITKTIITITKMKKKTSLKSLITFSKFSIASSNKIKFNKSLSSLTVFSSSFFLDFFRKISYNILASCKIPAEVYKFYYYELILLYFLTTKQNFSK